MKLDRREVLKVGALSLVGTTCLARRSSSDVPVIPPVGLQSANAPRDVGSTAPKPNELVLAFGSCNKPDLPQPIWQWVRAERPQAWLWLGDIVYADTENIERTRALYRMQRERPEYAALVDQTRILGVWDDHDFGKNDAGKEYPKRVESQSALLDFLGEPADSPRRRRRGTYESYELGSGNARVKVILLDGRYHREKPGGTADTLGAEQWSWFEKELASSTAGVTVVASSYQVLPEEHRNEKWANFPRARARLFDALKKAGTPGVVLLSGDRHFSELSRFDDSGIGYPLHELTSSGLTHSYANMVDEPNRHRVGKFYTRLNFGVVRVDWSRREVALETHGNEGNVPIRKTIPLETLRRKA
jgi:alkaline phosphatase D